MTSNNSKMKSRNTLKVDIPLWFIDHCNVNNIDLKRWYEWQVHLAIERKKLYLRMNTSYGK